MSTPRPDGAPEEEGGEAPCFAHLLGDSDEDAGGGGRGGRALSTTADGDAQDADAIAADQADR